EPVALPAVHRYRPDAARRHPRLATARAAGAPDHADARRVLAVLPGERAVPQPAPGVRRPRDRLLGRHRRPAPLRRAEPARLRRQPAGPPGGPVDDRRLLAAGAVLGVPGLAGLRRP